MEMLPSIRTSLYVPDLLDTCSTVADQSPYSFLDQQCQEHPYLECLAARHIFFPFVFGEDAVGI